jgi:hypothetical protein
MIVVTNSAMIGLAAIITACSALIWAIRRKP